VASIDPAGSFNRGDFVEVAEIPLRCLAERVVRVRRAVVQLSRLEKLALAALLIVGLLFGIRTYWLVLPDPLRQPTSLYPHVNAADTFQVVQGWPANDSEVSMGTMTGVAVAPDGHVWVVGQGHPPVREYDAQGNFIRGWGKGQIVMGHQIRLGPDGSVWIADAGRHCIEKFRQDGTRLLTLGTPGERGDDAGHFNEPTDMAFTPDGDVFVSDGYGNARVVHFRSDGTFVKAWGTRGSRPGQFSLVHSIVADKRGRLLVADRNNARIQVFDRDGRFIAQWVNLIVPWGLWVTSDGDVWVCGSSPAAWQAEQFALATPPHDQLLMRLDADGRVLQLWTVPVGRKPGQLDWVHAVAADADGNVYCADYYGQRIQKFQRVPSGEGTQSVLRDS
jgi:streptogramin lyase